MVTVKLLKLRGTQFEVGVSVRVRVRVLGLGGKVRVLGFRVRVKG